MTITERIDRTTFIPEEYRGTVIPVPKSVKVELTSRCNYKCSFCAHGHLDGKHRDMDFQFFKCLARGMREAGVEELGLFYIGESMLYPHLVEAVKYAKEIGYPYVFLTSNGSLATPTLLQNLMIAGLDSLKWSLNFSDSLQFTEIAGVKRSIYDKVLENIKVAHALRNGGGYKTRLYASSIQYDGEQLQKMQQVVEDVRPYVDEHYWLPLYSFGGVTGDSKAVHGNPGRAGALRPPLPCWSVFKEGHVTCDGLLSACCFDSSNTWEMADLREVDFVEGWNSVAYQGLRKRHLEGDVHGTPCETCIYGK
jgi:MoaA/NifB/PqqE/SkfB family radical SAM enzyme